MTDSRSRTDEGWKAPDRALGRRRGRVAEWVWCGSALAAARDRAKRLPDRQRARIARARAAAELAGRALDPVDPLRHGSSVPLAVSLYREAAYFAILAQDDGRDAPDLAAAFDGADRRVLAWAAGGEAALEAVREALAGRTFVQTDAIAASDQEADARRARAFVAALVERAIGPEREPGRVLLRRWARAGLGAGALIVAATVLALAIQAARRKPDLAAGKPWKQSSVWGACEPAKHTCGSVRGTDIFFHTLEDDSPWLEIDLGAPTAFSVVEITNRGDCCPDRAVPLVIEATNDPALYTEIARRTEAFGFWRAQVGPQKARFLRVRVLRKSWLHLEKVAVR